MPGPNT